MSETFLRIVNWEKYQHYKDRNPGWIKLYQSMLTSRAWIEGDGDQKALACGLLLLASRFENKIPFPSPYFVLSLLNLRRKGVTTSSFLRRFSALESCGFIEIDEKTLDHINLEEDINLEEKKNLLSELPKSSDEEPSESLFSQPDTESKPNVKARPSREGKRQHQPSHEAGKLADLFRQELLKQKPDFALKQKDVRKWAEIADKMIRIDKREPETIAELIRWARTDEFWQNNILGMASLREKFDQLQLKRAAADRPTKSRADRELEAFMARHSQ